MSDALYIASRILQVDTDGDVLSQLEGQYNS
jgi:hypothetical protein